eukprot:3567651-Prymnesium_polylepis.1
MSQATHAIGSFACASLRGRLRAGLAGHEMHAASRYPVAHCAVHLMARYIVTLQLRDGSPVARSAGGSSRYYVECRRPRH